MSYLPVCSLQRLTYPVPGPSSKPSPSSGPGPLEPIPPSRSYPSSPCRPLSSSPRQLWIFVLQSPFLL
ncbi:unnamed protein product [Meloidogyne enterolobii]|uniref:Uncharacterized protein n=1 Tax=Meloidogyne enterolobii TaxID=390850 RepID=A0ACB0YZV7_MELEN